MDDNAKNNSNASSENGSSENSRSSNGNYHRNNKNRNRRRNYNKNYNKSNAEKNGASESVSSGNNSSKNYHKGTGSSNSRGKNKSGGSYWLSPNNSSAGRNNSDKSQADRNGGEKYGVNDVRGEEYGRSKNSRSRRRNKNYSGNNNNFKEKTTTEFTETFEIGDKGGDSISRESSEENDIRVYGRNERDESFESEENVLISEEKYIDNYVEDSFEEQVEEYDPPKKKRGKKNGRNRDREENIFEDKEYDALEIAEEASEDIVVTEAFEEQVEEYDPPKKKRGKKNGRNRNREENIFEDKEYDALEIAEEASEDIVTEASEENHKRTVSSESRKRESEKNSGDASDESGETDEKKKKSETRFWSRFFSLAAIIPVYLAFVICMLALPRSTVSNIEKRTLATFPEFSWKEYWSGQYTADIANYFDDTVPFRDSLKQAGSRFANLFGIKYNNVQVSGQMQIVNDSSNKNEDGADSSDSERSYADSISNESTHGKKSDTDSEEETTPKGQEIADGVYTNGTIVIYQDGHYRAMSMYGGGSGDEYVNAVNNFADDLPGVQVYSMVDPTTSEFYTPLNFSDYNASQSDDIDSMNSRLSSKVKGINVCGALSKHVNEPIYTRTDHHWQSLGAYYAAQTFAKEAGVPVPDIKQYEKKSESGYVGTLYAFSGNNADLLNDPEDFVYYVPKNTDYSVEYYDYAYNFQFDGGLFSEIYDISEAYSSIIYGDAYTLKIKTNVKNGRKLCLVKDSYGNALTPFFVNSFEEIYVIDMRYFELNLVDFVEEQGITDLLFSCCSYSAVGPNADNLEWIRTMGGSVPDEDKEESVSSSETQSEETNEEETLSEEASEEPEVISESTAQTLSPGIYENNDFGDEENNDAEEYDNGGENNDAEEYDNGGEEDYGYAEEEYY